jgi:hypothetical protein
MSLGEGKKEMATRASVRKVIAANEKGQRCVSVRMTSATAVSNAFVRGARLALCQRTTTTRPIQSVDHLLSSHNTILITSPFCLSSFFFKMPNTVLVCPWMRPKDAVPYVAPPELFRNDSPSPLPAKPKVEVRWVSDVIQATPFKNRTNNKDDDDILPPPIASPIPCFLSPVPMVQSPTPSPVLAAPLAVKRKEGRSDFSRVQAISPTDSTRIGDLQLEEERQCNSSTNPHHDQETTTNVSAATTLLPSFDSAFQSVASKRKEVTDNYNQGIDESLLANTTAVLVTPPKQDTRMEESDAHVATATMNVAAIDPSLPKNETALASSAINDNLGDVETSHVILSSSSSSYRVDEEPSTMEMSMLTTADNEANVTVISLDSECLEDNVQVPKLKERVSVGQASFSSSSSRDKSASSFATNKSRLLVLVDMKSSNQTAVANQLYMFTVFGCSRIQYDKVDASNPESAALREQLLSLSNNSTQYPQFFLARDNGTLSFWGGFDRFFETADDNRKLVREFKQQGVVCNTGR